MWRGRHRLEFVALRPRHHDPLEPPLGPPRQLLLAYADAGHGIGEPFFAYFPVEYSEQSGVASSSNPLADAQLWPEILRYLSK